MENLIQISEFRERKRAASFVNDMLIARVTGACSSPATPETKTDPRNPIAPYGDGCSGMDSSTGSGRAPLRAAPVLLRVSCETSPE
jgi:hypothetical protein